MVSPALQPNQLAGYTEQCAAGAERKPVSTMKPHEVLAQTVVDLLAPASGAAGYEWKALAAVFFQSFAITIIGDEARAAFLNEGRRLL